MVNVLKFEHKVSDNMVYANSTDPDCTAPQGSTLFAILLSILRNNCIKRRKKKKKKKKKKVRNKVLKF